MYRLDFSDYTYASHDAVLSLLLTPLSARLGIQRRPRMHTVMIGELMGGDMRGLRTDYAMTQLEPVELPGLCSSLTGCSRAITQLEPVELPGLCSPLTG